MNFFTRTKKEREEKRRHSEYLKHLSSEKERISQIYDEISARKDFDPNVARVYTVSYPFERVYFANGKLMEQSEPKNVLNSPTYNVLTVTSDGKRSYEIFHMNYSSNPIAKSSLHAVVTHEDGTHDLYSSGYEVNDVNEEITCEEYNKMHKEFEDAVKSSVLENTDGLEL